MISIVIPVYNKKPFVAQAIRSVLDQTFRDFELILVNDGSTDGSQEVMASFDDARVRTITIQNSGASVARNTGIENSKYEWIALLDADDWWAPTFLEELSNTIRMNSEGKIFTSGRSRVFEDNTERYENEFLPEDGSSGWVNYFEVISRHLPPMHSSSVVIHKKLLSETGAFRAGQRLYEDHDLWLRLSVQNPCLFVNKPLSFYRKTREGSASAAKYEAADLCTYLETMIAVKESLSEDNTQWFKKYYNRFVTLTYAKYYYGYSKEDQRLVLGLIKQLVSKNVYIFLKGMNVLPFNMYPIFKSMR